MNCGHVLQSDNNQITYISYMFNGHFFKFVQVKTVFFVILRIIYRYFDFLTIKLDEEETSGCLGDIECLNKEILREVIAFQVEFFFEYLVLQVNSSPWDVREIRNSSCSFHLFVMANLYQFIRI